MNQTDTDLQSGSLVPLTIGDSEQLVPGNETLLSCFRFLRQYPILAGGFCGRAECGTCEVHVEYPSGVRERVLACRTGVVAGMRVLELSAKLRACLSDL